MRSIKNRLLLKGRKNKKNIITILFALVAMAGWAQVNSVSTQILVIPDVHGRTFWKEAIVKPSRGDRHLGYSSRHTQVPVPATTPPRAAFRRDGGEKLQRHQFFLREPR